MVPSLFHRYGDRDLIWRWTSTVIVCSLLVGSTITVPAGAVHDDRPSSHLTVTLDPDGSATVSLTNVHDLTDPAQRDAFVSIESDDAMQADARDRFASRMHRVASATAQRTGREMAITDESIDVTRTTDTETGVVTMSVTWSNLANVKDGTLELTEPFNSGFTSTSELVIRAPSGYEITEATPPHDTQDPRQATWSANTTLDEFHVVMTETQATRSPGQPGFDALVWVVGIAVALMTRKLA